VGSPTNKKIQLLFCFTAREVELQNAAVGPTVLRSPRQHLRLLPIGAMDFATRCASLA
jgi:hypothetical protein